MVDAVLYLEGERYQHYRVLRAAKNRFGSTNELGVFEMLDSGLREVANPSEAFLSDSTREVPGVAVVASLEGARPLLVEVQALVSTSFYGTPQRVTSGYDPRRLAVLLAVLERRVGLRLGKHDVFVTVTGGFKLDDPGADRHLEDGFSRDPCEHALLFRPEPAASHREEVAGEPLENGARLVQRQRLFDPGRQVRVGGLGGGAEARVLRARVLAPELHRHAGRSLVVEGA
jgi:hypothetical protein